MTESHTSTREFSIPERWAWIGAGLGLIGYSLLRRSWVSLPSGIAGGYLALRGVQEQRPGTELLRGGRRRDSRRAVLINCSAQELYSAWRQLRDLPRYFPRLESVTERDGRHSHWVARSRVRGQLEWDCDITADEPGKRLAWRSGSDGGFEQEGEIRFLPGPPERGTRVELRWRHHLPGLMASLLAAAGEAPDQVAREGLRRFKQWMETGEIATTAGQPHGPRTRLAELAPVFSPAPPRPGPAPVESGWGERTGTD